MRRYRTESERKNIRSGRRGPELGTTVRHELCRSGIVAIQGEMRRSLLVDPLVEPIDREALVKAILAPIGVLAQAMGFCHSARAAEGRVLQVSLSIRWRSWLRWLWTLALTDANFASSSSA